MEEKQEEKKIDQPVVNKERTYKDYMRILGLGHLIDSEKTKNSEPKEESVFDENSSGKEDVLNEFQSDEKMDTESKKEEVTELHETEEEQIQEEASTENKDDLIVEKNEVELNLTEKEVQFSQEEIESNQNLEIVEEENENIEIKETHPEPEIKEEEFEKPKLSLNQEQNPSMNETVISEIIEKPNQLDEGKKQEELAPPKSIADNNLPKHTFGRWLILNQTTRNIPNLKKNEIIDRFIQKNPKIKPIDKSKLRLELPEKSIEKEKNQEIVTETLAKLYAKQGKYEEAIKAYEALRLKFPKKSNTFASRIKKLSSKLNKIK